MSISISAIQPTYRIIEEIGNSIPRKWRYGPPLSERQAAAGLVSLSRHTASALFAESEDGQRRYVADMDADGQLYLLNVEDM